MEVTVEAAVFYWRYVLLQHGVGLMCTTGPLLGRSVLRRALFTCKGGGGSPVVLVLQNPDMHAAVTLTKRVEIFQQSILDEHALLLVQVAQLLVGGGHGFLKIVRMLIGGSGRTTIMFLRRILNFFYCLIQTV